MCVPVGSADSEQLMPMSWFIGAGPTRGLKRKQHPEKFLHAYRLYNLNSLD